MQEIKYNSLLNKLNSILNVGGDAPSVSPAFKDLEDAGLHTPGFIFIDKDINIEKLSMPEKLLVHALLHQFYALGCKNLSKSDIEQLHAKVKTQINHTKFDKLDEK